jgi:membrane-associated phospholipid phosphatase
MDTAQDKEDTLIGSVAETKYEPKSSEDPPYKSFPLPLKFSLFMLLLIMSIITLTSGKYILVWSSNISYSLQQFGGKPLFYLAQIFSTLLTVWTIPVVIFYNHLSNNSKDSYYHFMKFMIANCIGVTFKTVFYQGRPYLVNKDVYGCTCDPGMPSGHSIMAVSGYYMAFIILSQRVDYFKSSPTKLTIIRIICIIFPLGIMWSRVQLAAHSLDQISIGALISLNVIVWFDYQQFEKMYSYFETRPFFLPVTFTIFMTIFGSAFILINHEKREDTNFWLYWNKCPACLNTFVVAASKNTALVFVLPGFIMFYPYEKKRYTTMLEDHFLLYDRKWSRFVVFLVNVCILPAILFAVLQFIQTTSINGIYGASFFWFKLLSPLAFFVGISMSFLNEYLYEKLNINQCRH